MNRSPLHELNASLGARFVDFGGWEMPVQYESVLTEHRAVRTDAGLFDVSHLGRFELTGPGARAAVRGLLCNDIQRIAPGQCQYTLLLNADGGIVDDMIVWWLEEETFWVLPNAANQQRVMARFDDERGCRAADLQTETVMIAVQGPRAPATLDQAGVGAPGRFKTATVDWGDGELRVAGTGYTGEPGAEICTDPATGEALVAELVASGLRPCGLGARDTLRLEAGLTLWGADIDETTTPLEAGLDFAVALDHDFVGRQRLVEQAERGPGRRLTGFVLTDRGVPRSGHLVRTAGGGEGRVTSGNMSPMIGRGIGLAYLAPPPQPAEALQVEIRGRWVGGQVAEPPFHLTSGAQEGIGDG